MTGTRNTLTLYPDKQPPDDKEAEIAEILNRAIEHNLCVRWTYKPSLMQAAPHILYRKNGGLYLDAVVTQYDGSIVDDDKLASFKLTTLVSPAVTTEAFEPRMVFDPAEPRYRDGIVARAVV